MLMPNARYAERAAHELPIACRLAVVSMGELEAHDCLLAWLGAVSDTLPTSR